MVQNYDKEPNTFFVYKKSIYLQFSTGILWYAFFMFLITSSNQIQKLNTEYLLYMSIDEKDIMQMSKEIDDELQSISLPEQLSKS